ncbi:MAG: hypothetical protein IIA33_10800 [Planctomycetes bacterium]|nr:hypothetical protein [Planctomycetota bacterium]
MAATLADDPAGPGKARFPWRNGRAVKFVGMAAAVAAAVVLWTATRDVSPPSPQADNLADLVADDYRRFVEEGKTVQLASADAAEVSAWLRGQTGLEVSIGSITGHGCRLVGARKCKLAGRPAAFALYDMAGTPVSLVATDGAAIGVGQMKRVDNGASEYWVDRCAGHTVVATRAGDLIYAAVSTLPQNDLIHFIESVVHESD